MQFRLCKLCKVKRLTKRKAKLMWLCVLKKTLRYFVLNFEKLCVTKLQTQNPIPKRNSNQRQRNSNSNHHAT